MATPKAKKVKKAKKIVLTLSARDAKVLKAWASTQRITSGKAAKRLLHKQLQQLSHLQQEAPAANQLCLFDSIQIDIFNRTSRTAPDNLEGDREG